MDRLLLEIGTEEIPSGYIRPALEALSAKLLQKIDEMRIAHGTVRTFGTPRRLAILVADVADRQAASSTEIIGPPERVAFDADGKPTVAAIKFAEKAGVPLSRVQIRETEKGRYLCVNITQRGQTTVQALSRLLPDLILSIPFPKTMRWGELRIAFARPVHSIAALYGSRIIPFRLGNIKSGRYTFGHRFTHPGKIKLESPDSYLERLEESGVIADISVRRNQMLDRVQQLVHDIGGTIIEDDELIETVTQLVEYPAPVLGTFDTGFLLLPPEILITAMREHQRYFAVVDGQGRMMPHFVAVNNTRARDMQVVTSGHERVLRARLEDARFFYNSDIKTPLPELVPKLKQVLFQTELGSVYDKIVRVRDLGRRICGRIGIDDAVADQVARAAWLCKADLVTHVVGEFPKLQGVMGRIYALAANEPEAVAGAIEEHYRPTFSGGPLPSTRVAAILSIADKVDTLCGCFNVGLIPTGAADPYALRRQAFGIIQTVLDQDLTISLTACIDDSLALFAVKPRSDDPEKAPAVLVYEFLKSRMAHLLEEEGVPRDLVAAVLSVSGDNICDVWKRAHALHRLKAAPDFEPIAAAFKRVVNIIRKADFQDLSDTAVDPARFADASETELYRKGQQVRQAVDECISNGQIDVAFSEIARMRPVVDLFFDKVLVMAEDPAVRKNRLALLKEISDIFSRLVDFTKIST